MIKKKREILSERRDPESISKFTDITKNIGTITNCFAEQIKFYFPHTPLDESTVSCFSNDRISKNILLHPSNMAMFIKSEKCGRIALVDLIERRDLRWYVGNSNNVESMDVSRNGKFLVSGTSGGVVKAFEVESGLEIKLFPLQANSVVKVLFSERGALLMTVSGEGKSFLLTILDFQSESEKFGFKYVSESYENVSFAADDKAIVVFREEKTIEIRNLVDGAIIASIDFQSEFPNEKPLAGKLFYDIQQNSLFKVDRSGSFKFDFNSKTVEEVSKVRVGLIKCEMSLKRRTISFIESFSSGSGRYISYWKYRFCSYEIDSKKLNQQEYSYFDYSTIDLVGEKLIFFKKGFVSKFLELKNVDEAINSEKLLIEEKMNESLFTFSPLKKLLAQSKNLNEPMSIISIENLSITESYLEKSQIIGIAFNFLGEELITVNSEGLIQRKLINVNKEEKELIRDLSFPIEYCNCSIYGNFIIVSKQKETDSKKKRGIQRKNHKFMKLIFSY